MAEEKGLQRDCWQHHLRGQVSPRQILQRGDFSNAAMERQIPPAKQHPLELNLKALRLESKRSAIHHSVNVLLAILTEREGVFNLIETKERKWRPI